jgi:hypothetical protein
VVLLYGNDLARAQHPERYTVTPSATPMSQLDALSMVRASHPVSAIMKFPQREGLTIT